MTCLGVLESRKPKQERIQQFEREKCFRNVILHTFNYYVPCLAAAVHVFLAIVKSLGTCSPLAYTKPK